MVNEAEWHNTGRNGAAREVWVRKVNGRTAIVSVMPFRVILEMFVGTRELDASGIGFDGKADALRAADAFLAEVTS